MREYGVKFSLAFSALSKTTAQVTRLDYFIIEAQAIDRDGKPIKIHIGFERGMTDSGQPCWSSHGATHFETIEEGLEMCKYLSLERWGFKGDPTTIKPKRVVSTTVEYYDEYDVDEAERIIKENQEGFKRYMESR